MKPKLLLALILFIGAATGVFAQPPTITSFSPSQGTPGTLVTINGTNLGNPTLFTIGKDAIVISNTGTQLVGYVMPYSASAPITITTAGGTATSSTNFTVNATSYPTIQEGNPMINTIPYNASTGTNIYQGSSVAVSADGKTALVGAPYYLDGSNNQVGIVWVYVWDGTAWVQQAALQGVTTGYVLQGSSVALSADGNTAMIGGVAYGGLGAVWFFTRSGGVWTLQGGPLVGAGYIGSANQGTSCSLSADGNTAVEGGPDDNYANYEGSGAIWVFTRNGGVWSQFGPKLTASDNAGDAQLGSAVGISADGYTIIAGGPEDTHGQGATWIFTQRGGTGTPFIQLSTKLVGTGGTTQDHQGYSVALSADGYSALVGAPGSNSVFAFDFVPTGGTYFQFGSVITGTGITGSAGNDNYAFGTSVSFSADATTAMIGGSHNGDFDSPTPGGTWMFTLNGLTYTQQLGPVLGTGPGTTQYGAQGTAVALSATGTTGIIGGPTNGVSFDNDYNYNLGGAWAFMVPAPPTLTYTSPQTYIENTTITPLDPSTNGVAAPGYNNTPVVLGSGFSGPTGVAVDAAGNVYVADRGNDLVKKIPAGNGTPVTVSSGFSQPYGVAVDAAGDVYVADYGANAVYKIAAGSNTRLTIGSGFSHPTGVAIDASGDVYVADYGNNEVKKIPAGTSSPVVIGAGFYQPVGVAVDAAGDVYVSDRVHNAVKEIPAGSNTPVAVGSGFNNPFGVAVDASGNVYVGDFNNNAVKMIPAGSNTPVVMGSAFSSPDGVAVDGAGNVYVADYGNNAVKEIEPVGGFYIGPFLPAGLSFNNTTGTISGTPTAESTATNYTVTAYNSIGSGTAALTITVTGPLPVISYAGPQTYTEGTAITPLTPVSSNVASPGYSTSPAVLGSGFSGPTGVAVDAAGDVYVADRGNGRVKKIPAGNGAPVIISSGFSLPYGVAVDPAGDIYVADYGANAVYEIAAGTNTRITIGSGFSHPTGVAIDAAGDVYVADYGNNAVKEIPAGSNTPQVIGSGFGEPVGVAVDAAGDVYIGDRAHNAVKEIAAGSNIPVIIGSGFNNPFGVAVDASGNVYVSDFNNNQVKMIPAGSNTPVVIGSGFSNPDGVAVDGAGNVYVADYGNNAVKQITPVGGYYIGPFLSAGLSFNNTTGTISGTPTVASPATNYTVTAYNSMGAGTATLSIAVLSNNANLSNLVLSSGPLTPVFATGTTSYTANVAGTVASVTVTPTTSDPTAIVHVNGTIVASGTASAAQPLVPGPNTITTLVTAQNGATNTYTITVTQAGGAAFRPVNYAGLVDSASMANDGILVHQGVSPNGDGINDFLMIDGITRYPDNHLMIINLNGALIYRAKGYDNSKGVFDGHSNINGKMQVPGTYFYALDYSVNGLLKHRTGYIVLKY